MNNNVTVKNIKFYNIRCIRITYENSKFELAFQNNGVSELYYKNGRIWTSAPDYIIPTEAKIILMNFFWELKMTLEMDCSNV